MKIVIIGGAGHVARAAARVMRAHDAISRIVFADIDASGAEESAADFEGLAQAVKLDVRDSTMLASVLNGARCVVNLAGPYFEFGPLVLKAAIDAKVDYIDICDDWEPTIEMLEMGPSAAAAGITAILGMGSSPGTSNLLAKVAMDRLDTTEKVYTLWQAGNPDMGFVDAHTDQRNPRRASAALVHGVMQMTGTITAFRGGKIADVMPLTAVEINAPELGPVTGAVFGHPEPITLPRFGRVTDEALCLCMMTSDWLNLLEEWIIPLNDLPLIDYQLAADDYLNGVRAYNESGGLAPNSSLADLPRTFVYAEGKKDGVHKKVAAYLTAQPSGGMPETTGTPLAIALSMLLDGEIARPGVWAPEDCIEPLRFFARYKAYCASTKEGVDVVHLAES